MISIKLICGDKNFDFDEHFKPLFKEVETLSDTSSIKAYVYKYYARYLLRIRPNRNALEYFLKAEKIYNKTNSRKIVYLFFDFAEYYRSMMNFEKSKIYYQKCINFAIQYNEKNLEIISKLGLILIKIANKKYNEDDLKECYKLKQKAQILDTNVVAIQLDLVILFLSNNNNINFAYYLEICKYNNLFNEYRLLCNIIENSSNISEMSLNLA